MGFSSTFEAQVNASVGIEESDAGFTLQLYPNPAGEKAFVVSPLEGNMVVIDQAGRKVLDDVNVIPNTAQMIDSSTWAEGMYQVVITTSTGSRTARLVKVN